MSALLVPTIQPKHASLNGMFISMLAFELMRVTVKGIPDQKISEVDAGKAGTTLFLEKLYSTGGCT